MEFFRQFGLLFSNMEWYIAVFFAVGTILIIIEMFIPGFGVFGISGISSFLLSILLRALIRGEGDVPVFHIFQMILLEGIVLGGTFGIVFLSGASKKFIRSPFALYETAIDTERSEGTENFGYLLNLEGRAVTDLKPVGKALIEDKIYDVVTNSFFIGKDSEIKVVGVEGGKIEVAPKR